MSARYFMNLHNLQQAGDIEFTSEALPSGVAHNPTWGCYIVISKVNNRIYNNVAGFTYIGNGDNRAAAKDQAAYNALRGLGFNFQNMQ